MVDRQAIGHVREHGSILARSEKRALIWMASGYPAGSTPIT